MASQAAQFDLSTSFLNIPRLIAYGLVRGAGNLVLQQALTDGTRVSFYMLGEGPWDSILRLWINDALVTLPNTSIVHFHPGTDGEIGNGLGFTSTGGDQHVDQFFTLIPGGLDPVTFSRYAWLALKVAPDPDAPSADLTVLADYQAMQVRQFDSSGNQTAFAWTQNWAWIICDYLIRKFVLREGKVNQPLVSAELARFDWQSFSDAAAYYDVVLGAGQKRFSDGGVVYLNDGDTADSALEQMLLMCRSYLLERNGKLSLYADKPRASVFTFTIDDIEPGTFKAYKTNVRTANNRLTPTYRDSNIADGSTDDATRFAITPDPQLNHEAHQRTVGARGPGLSLMPKITELQLDLGVNTPERVWRILKAMLVRQLGDDVDANTVYNAPFNAQWTAYEDSDALECGDLVTIDPSISEQYGGKIFEVQEVDYNEEDGTRDFTGLEYEPNAFPDVAPAQQLLQAPDPGSGLGTAASSVDSSGNLQVPMDNTVDSADRYARTTGNSTYRPLSNMLTAHDAGSNVTINVAGFTMRVTGSPDFACAGGSVPSLSYGTRYFLYFDDGTMTGGAETYNASTTKETAINGSGRFFIGSILTPVSGAADTSGNNDGGTGAQAGFLQICLPTTSANTSLGGTSTFTTPAAAYDGDFSTSAELQNTSTSGGTGRAQQTFSVFERPAFPPTSQTLRVTSSGNAVSGVEDILEYSLDAGSTWHTIWDVISSGRTKQTDSIALPSGTDINKSLVVRQSVLTPAGTITGRTDIFEIWVEALA